MPTCQYCGCDATLTREHVIPNWYSHACDYSNKETFNARRPIGQTKGDLLVKDVCAECNNGPLAALDAYGKNLHKEFFSIPAYLGERTNFTYDYHMLLRWLLKICYNSGRAHGADTIVLSQYAPYILGIDHDPPEHALMATVFACIDWSQTPPAPSHRIIGANDDIERPSWFRIAQHRSNKSNQSYIVQRQVYIDAFCFTLFATDPGNPHHSEELVQIVQELQETGFDFKHLSTSGQVTIPTSRVNAEITFYRHMVNYPRRYSLFSDAEGEDEKSKVASKLASLIADKNANVMLTASREQVESLDVEDVAGTLESLVSSKELLMGAVSRVGVTIDGYCNDPRDLWEIGEAREWFDKLFRRCPYVCLLANPHFKTLELLFVCLCVEEGTSGNPVSIDPRKADDFLKTSYLALNAICQEYGLSYELNRRISDSLGALVGC